MCPCAAEHTYAARHAHHKAHRRAHDNRQGNIVTTQTLSDIGLQLIQGFEGFHRALDGGERAQAYRDAVGVLTIGWGHTRTVKSDDMTITRAQAEDLLRSDVSSAEAAVNKAVKVSLNQNQFDALVSFVFNLGEGNFRKSTLLKKLNNGNYAEVPSELLRWVNAGGKPLPGLVRRRKAEATLFEAAPSDAVEVGHDGQVTVRLSASAVPEQDVARNVETVNAEKPLTESRTMQAGTAAGLLAGMNTGVNALNEFASGAQSAASSATSSLSELTQALQAVGADGALLESVAQAQQTIQDVESQVALAQDTVETAKGLPDQIKQVFVSVNDQIVSFSSWLEAVTTIPADTISLVVWGLVILLIFRMLQARIDDRNKGRR